MDDSAIISSGADGAVYQWNLAAGGKREGEFVQKGISFEGAVTNVDGSAIFATSSNQVLKEIEVPSSQLAAEYPVVGRDASQVRLNRAQHFLFLTTSLAGSGSGSSDSSRYVVVFYIQSGRFLCYSEDRVIYLFNMWFYSAAARIYSDIVVIQTC